MIVRFVAHPGPELIMSGALVGGVERRVQVGGEGGRKPGDDLLAGDEPVPLVIGGRPARVGVGGVAVVAAAREKPTLVFCPVDGDGLPRDVSLGVEVVPRDRDEDDPVANNRVQTEREAEGQGHD